MNNTLNGIIIKAKEKGSDGGLIRPHDDKKV